MKLFLFFISLAVCLQVVSCQEKEKGIDIIINIKDETGLINEKLKIKVFHYYNDSLIREISWSFDSGHYYTKLVPGMYSFYVLSELHYDYKLDGVLIFAKEETDNKFEFNFSLNTKKVLYSSDLAFQNLSNGDTTLLFLGLPVISLDSINNVAKKYNFKYVFIGDAISDELINEVNDYNQYVRNVLISKNGINWFKHFEAELDSLD